MGSSEPREGLAICRAKEVPSFLSYFKTLSIGPIPGIEPATFRSVVKVNALPTELNLTWLNEKYFGQVSMYAVNAGTKSRGTKKPIR